MAALTSPQGVRELRVGERGSANNANTHMRTHTTHVWPHWHLYPGRVRLGWDTEVWEQRLIFDKHRFSAIT